MSTDQKEKLSGWLAKQGYLFEFRIAQYFRKTGWEAWRCRFHKDPSSLVSCQLDIYASTSAHDEEGDLDASIAYAVE